MRRPITLALLSTALAAGACTATTSGPSPFPHPGAGPLPGATVLTLVAAEHRAADVGPVAPTAPMSVTLALRPRDRNELAGLLAAGRSVTPAEWASTYGPDPAAMAVVEQRLRSAGMTPTWSPGDTLLTATGAASSVERLFGVAIDRFVLGDRTRFYGPVGALSVPAVLAAEVAAVTGATDYHEARLAATRGTNGMTPDEVANFYDITPLRQAGLDGSGVTVMFPEWAMPSRDVLDAFATKFAKSGVPPFDVTVRQMFGPPKSPTSPEAGEAALDLEIVHGLAPAAKEVVYEVGDDTRLPDAIQAMINDNPHAVMSSSIGNFGCEAEPGARANAAAMDAVLARAAAQGISVFWASGDSGAYACLTDGNSSTQNDISVDADGTDSPSATAVGGTSVFEAANGGYFKEAAWGEPLEQAGGGGGISTLFPQPSYQVAPGLAAGSLHGRGVPDVSCNADPVVGGWDVFSPADPSQGQSGPREGGNGGTSAAAPCWAAITALIDQDLANLRLAPVGFANPALYYFSRYPAGLPAAPFHAVTEGSNLHYLATAGWNAATGLGSPDAAHLADDFEWYERKTP